MKHYYVYLMASISGVLYVGMTSDLKRRVQEHKSGRVSGFTQRYRTKKLVYFERYSEVHDAIAREKQIKKWHRVKKVALVESQNPTWQDYAASWNY